LGQYRANLLTLIQLARQHNVRPIFITQPAIYQENLPAEAEALLWLGEYDGDPEGGYYSVSVLQQTLTMFNQEMLATCEENAIECIDVAVEMNGETDYFFDDVHFNELGARRVGEIVTQYLSSHLPFVSS
jgi:lysophospholipase L1-like esterase